MSITTQRLSQDDKIQHKEKLNQHIKETGSPETYPCVVLAPPSSRDADFQLIAEFDVDRKSRPNEEMVPCSICSPGSGKYLHGGWLAFFPEDSYFRLVGPTCGKKDLKNFAVEKQKYFREQEITRRREFAQHNIDLISEVIEQIPVFRRKALAAISFRQKFKRKFPEVYKQFEYAARRSDKQLTIRLIIEQSEYQDNLRRRPGEEFVDIGVAILHGASVFDGTFRPTYHVDRATKILQEHTISSARSFLRSDNDEIPDFPKHWRQALGFLSNAREQIEATRLFLTEHNFQGVNHWGQHKENRISFQATWKKGDTYLTDGKEELQGVISKQLQYSCPNIPKLP